MSACDHRVEPLCDRCGEELDPDRGHRDTDDRLPWDDWSEE